MATTSCRQTSVKKNVQCQYCIQFTPNARNKITQTSSNKTKYMEAEKCFSKLHKMKNVASLVSLWKKNICNVQKRH